MKICDRLNFGNVVKEGVDLTLFLSNADQPQSIVINEIFLPGFAVFSLVHLRVRT